MAIDESLNLPDRSPPGAATPDRLWRLRPGNRTRRNGRWYSRFVSLLKLILPMTAIAIMALVALWPTIQNELKPPPPAPVISERTSSQLLGPRYVGTDERNQPITIVADSADQVGEDGEIVVLARPDAAITLEDGTELSLSARSGRYDRAGAGLYLNGGVNLRRDDGVSLVTEEAHVDLENRNAWGDLPVSGDGPFGEVSGEGFRIEDEGDTVILIGQSRLLLLRGAGEVLQ
ncbi:MAG: LPS export ABC transporter periplasmic protein LptC [Inquilinaceae bacterium]